MGVLPVKPTRASWDRTQLGRGRMRARAGGAKRRSARSHCTPRPGTAAIHKGASRRWSGHGR
eukprot:12595519-Alexandrium_andersonii.AAC.1